MKEQELNTLMSVVSDPIKNVYKIESRKDLEEIQRIIRIFNISENQHNKHTMLSIKNLATLRLVLKSPDTRKTERCFFSYYKYFLINNSFASYHLRFFQNNRQNKYYLQYRYFEKHSLFVLELMVMEAHNRLHQYFHLHQSSYQTYLYPTNNFKSAEPKRITPTTIATTEANITAPAEISLAIPTNLEYRL